MTMKVLFVVFYQFIDKYLLIFFARYWEANVILFYDI